MAGVWVLSGPGLPCGARVLGPAGDGRTWVDVCVLGQHLPQMYPPEEIHDLDRAGCDRMGLCPDCLGWGDNSPGLPAGLAEAARGIDEVASACVGCGGSGRPALRVAVTRDSGNVAGTIRPIPHLYVPPLDGSDPVLRAAFGVPDDMCLACDEDLHVDG
jgi:hypothetical protein